VLPWHPGFSVIARLLKRPQTRSRRVSHTNEQISDMEFLRRVQIFTRFVVIAAREVESETFNQASQLPAFCYQKVFGALSSLACLKANSSAQEASRPDIRYADKAGFLASCRISSEQEFWKTADNASESQQSAVVSLINNSFLSNLDQFVYAGRVSCLFLLISDSVIDSEEKFDSRNSFPSCERRQSLLLCSLCSAIITFRWAHILYKMLHASI
jgi:hypothetical protein